MDARTHKPIRRILLSNDDGIDAIGLKILYDIAVQFSDDVWVIAPLKTDLGRHVLLHCEEMWHSAIGQRFSCSGLSRLHHFWYVANS